MKSTEPELWAQWEQYREVPESFGAIARSNLIVAMAPHVNRFVSALFSVGPDVEALIAQTRAYDILFRFKIDFVRRRALPLLKAGAHVEATVEDHALIERVTAGSSDPEMTLAAYGCSLLDREATDKAELGRGDRIAEAVVRGSRSRPPFQGMGGVPFSGKPRLRPSRPGAASRSGAAGADGRTG